MMGYSGLGMQSWIYKRKLHKPFSKRGKVPSFHSLPLYSRTFSLKSKNKSNTRRLGLITVTIILLFCSALYIFGNKFTSYNKQYSVLMEEYKENLNAEAFSFLMNSGKNRFRANNIEGAYSEFSLAYKIEPKNEELLNLLIETSNLLCENKSKYCEDLEKYMNL